MTQVKRNGAWHETVSVQAQSGRKICIAETEAGLMLKLKGTHTQVLLPWGTAFEKACQLEADRNVDQKRRTPIKRGIMSGL